MNYRKTLRQVAIAFRDPKQRSFRIAPRGRRHKTLERFQQTRLLRRLRLAATARTPQPTVPARRPLAVEFGETAPDPRAGNPGDLAHQLDPAPSHRAGFYRREEPPSLLVEVPMKRLVTISDGFSILHTPYIAQIRENRNPLPTDRSNAIQLFCDGPLERLRGVLS